MTSTTESAAATATLPLVESFGPTLQGEGPAAGRAAWFLRFGGCDLSCRWCDSAYTWDGSSYDLRSEITATPAEHIADGVPHGSLVILTGGEPLLHQDSPGWAALLRALDAAECELHVETNGTRVPNDLTCRYVATFVVSPKLANAGNHRGNQDPTLAPGWPALAWEVDAHLKFVVAGPRDVDTAQRYATQWVWPAGRRWVMPLGTSSDQLGRVWPGIAAAAAARGMNATHRLHVLAWGDERGH